MNMTNNHNIRFGGGGLLRSVTAVLLLFGASASAYHFGLNPGRPADDLAISTSERPIHSSQQAASSSDLSGPVDALRESTQSTNGLAQHRNDSHSRSGQQVRATNADRAELREAVHDNVTTTSLESPVTQVATTQHNRQLARDVEYLASDQMEGRGVGTYGLDLASDYLAARFEMIGLRTDVVNGSAFQEFRWQNPFIGASVTELALVDGASAESSRHSLTYGQDYRAISSGPAVEFDLPLVFAGYGITAPELQYDDYRDIQARDCAVVILRHEPQQVDSESVFNGADASEFAPISAKVANAISHGAGAIVFVTDGPSLLVSGQESDPLLAHRVTLASGRPDIPVVHIRRSVIDRILTQTIGTTLNAIEVDIDRDMQPRSASLDGVRLTGRTTALGPRGSLRNVIAVKEASQIEQQETIVIGAHYDHLGWGGSGSLSLSGFSEIHNGADDNASGTAVMLRVAELLADRKLRRRIAFVGFTAEEQGLVGSAHYVRNPVIPLDKTVAMLNLDMVGRLRENQLTAYGANTAAEFPGLLNRLAESHRLSVKLRSGGFGPSDHASFHAKGIPVLHFFTGFHSQYHSPDDDFETLNLDGMEQIAGMVADLTEQLANLTERPAPPSSRASPEHSSLASVRAAQSRSAWLGVQRNAGAEESGFTVLQVVQFSPAARAGMRPGDIITHVNDSPISQPDDLTSLLAAMNPDDRVTMLVRRGIADLAINVTLGVRP